MLGAALSGRRLWVAALMALAFGMATIGCGQAAPERGRLFGKVTVDGVPVAKGQIRLFALSAEGVGTDASIVDGKYDVPPDRGLTAANYRVEIVSLKTTGRRVPDPDTNALVDEIVNLLPPRYNTQSTLQITYQPGSNAPHDFDLKTK